MILYFCFFLLHILKFSCKEEFFLFSHLYLFLKIYMASTYGFILVFESYNPILLFIFLYLLNMIELLGTLSNWFLDPSGSIPRFLKHILTLVSQNKDMMVSWFSEKKKGRKEQNRTTTTKNIRKNESCLVFSCSCCLFPDFTMSSFKLPIVCQWNPCCTFPAIRHFSKKPWWFLLDNGI